MPDGSCAAARSRARLRRRRGSRRSSGSSRSESTNAARAAGAIASGKAPDATAATRSWLEQPRSGVVSFVRSCAGRARRGRRCRSRCRPAGRCCSCRSHARPRGRDHARRRSRPAAGSTSPMPIPPSDEAREQDRPPRVRLDAAHQQQRDADEARGRRPSASGPSTRAASLPAIAATTNAARTAAGSAARPGAARSRARSAGRASR